MQVHLTPKSANAKTGPIPVSTTTSDSCPTDCAMRAELADAMLAAYDDADTHAWINK